MKKILFAALMSLSIGGLSASIPCLNNENMCDVSCYSPCAPSYASCASDTSCCNDGMGISIDADFLWWDAQAENITTTVIQSNNVTSLTTNTNYDFDYQWRPGFRIELGYVTCLGGYNVDLFAKWTWYRTTYSRHFELTAGAGEFVSISDPIISVSANGDEQLGAVILYDISTSFLYERLDLGLMSDCFQVGYFTFKPSAAFTYAFIQDTYRGASSRDVEPSATTDSTRGKFSGAGITIGANVTYPIMCDTFLYSVSELSGLWGNVRVNTTNTNLDPNISSATVTRMYQDDFWAGRLIIAQEFGIGYSSCVWSLPVSAHLGWQFLYLPNFNMMTTLSTFHDRTINGLVAGVAVGF